MPNLTFGDSAPMSITGHDSSATGVTDVPFVTFGQTGVKSLSSSFFVSGSVNPVDTGGLYLFIYQNTSLYNSNTNPVSMFIWSNFAYVVGTSYNSRSPLYMFAGSFRCEAVNLFIKTDPVNKFNAFSRLSVVGSQGYGSFSSIPLHIIGHTQSKTMNLVIEGGDKGGQSRVIRFFIKSEYPSTQSSSSLFINNQTQYQESPITDLFIRGDGNNPGYTPYGESLGIHIERGPNAGITMYIQNSTVPSAIPLHIVGAPMVGNTASLFTQGLGGKLEATQPLIIQGGVFQGNNAVSTLVIPNIRGFQPNVAYLYTNGFEY